MDKGKFIDVFYFYPQKLALTSPTGGGRSVGMVRSRTKATEFSLVFSSISEIEGRVATGMGWKVRGSNPGGSEIFRNCPDRPWGPLSLLYNGYRVFPGGKERPGCDADPSPPSGAVVKKE